jgi:hypothetical protein
MYCSVYCTTLSDRVIEGCSTRYRTALHWYRYQIPDTRYRIPDTGYRIPDTGYLIPDTWYRIPDTWYLIPDARFQIPDIPDIPDLKLPYTDSFVLPKLTNALRCTKVQVPVRYYEIPKRRNYWRFWGVSHWRHRWVQWGRWHQHFCFVF